MSLRDRLRQLDEGSVRDLYGQFGILANPFPALNQTIGHPRLWLAEDKEAEDRVVAFLRNSTSRVVVIEGVQGVGKTNFLSHFEADVRNALEGRPGYYVVRYLPYPEESFDGTTRQVVTTLGKAHLDDLVGKLRDDDSAIAAARGQDMKAALESLVRSEDEEVKVLMMEWLLGLPTFKSHRETLGVQFRLDTAESMAAALKDLAEVSAQAGVLRGIFLLLDEIEKQDGVLSMYAVLRCLSSLRAMIDALPQRLFLMIAVSPDALHRYAAWYPALRSRLADRLEMKALTSCKDAKDLAKFYLDRAREAAAEKKGAPKPDTLPILSSQEIEDCFVEIEVQARERGDDGVSHRALLHKLHERANAKFK